MNAANALHFRLKNISLMFKLYVIEVSNNDILLQSMIKNKIIILQKFDPDRNNKLCDIEEDDKIENKSEVKVLLFDKSSNLVTEPIYTSIISDISQDKQIDETCAMDVKVIHTEPINLDLDNTKLLMEIEKSSIVIDDVEEKILIQEKYKETENDIAIPSANDDMTNNSLQNEGKMNLSKELGSIPYPAILPPLSYDLQYMLKNDGILKAQRHFIAFWGQYLWQTTHTKPTKQDYNNLASSIVAAYPQLAGGKNGCEIVRSQLSTWIRNHRAFLKKQTIKRDYEGKPKISTDVASVIQTSALIPTESDVKNALKELEKKVVENNNMSHVKRLLEITMSVRRQWIEKESSRIVEIVSKYLPLKYYEMMLFELLNMKSITENILFDKTNFMIDKLMKYCSIENSNEKSKAYVMEQLCQKLSYKKFKKQYSPLFIVKEVMCSTENLKIKKQEAPRVVMYTSIEGEIAAAYIVADKTIKVKIPQPTVSKVIVGLLSAYYVWYVEYPTCYASVLKYIDYEILTTPLKGSTVVAKFIRERDNTLKATNSVNK